MASSKAAEKAGYPPPPPSQGSKKQGGQKKSQMGLMSGRNNPGRKEEGKAMVKVKNSSGRYAGSWTEGGPRVELRRTWGRP